MRITYLHQYFNTPEMAGGTRSYEMARRLVAKGHEVNMITSWRENDGRRGWFETEEAGIRVHWLPVPYSNQMGYRERIQAFFRFAWGAARKAASIPTDVVFATSTPLTIALPGGYAKWRRKVPMVFEVRDLWPDVPIAVGALKNPVAIKIASRVERFAYMSSDHIVALAPGMREGVISKGIRPEKVSVIPNGADMEAFQGCRSRPSEMSAGSGLGHGRLIVYFGAIGLANGVSYIPRLAKNILDINPKSDLKFVILGDGRARREVEALARRLGVAGVNVFFLGAVPKKEVPKWLDACDASIMTYHGPEILYRDSVSNKFFDSIASGKPVIANFEGFSTLLAKKHEAGLILPKEDVHSAAISLSEWIGSEQKRKACEANALKLAQSHFDRARLASLLDDILVGVGSGEEVGVLGADYIKLWDGLKNRDL